jgi:hypothetical protein
MELPAVESELVIVNRAGQVESKIGPPVKGLYPSPALSPGERTVVAPVIGRAASIDLWSFDMNGAAPQRLTFDEAFSTYPMWSSDGSDLYYYRFRDMTDFKIVRIPAGAGATGEDAVASFWPPALTPDGKTMVYGAVAPGFNQDLWIREVNEEGPGTPLLTDPDPLSQPVLSPDGRFLVYLTGGQVLVRTFPDMEGPWQVGPGLVARWSPSSDRLFYMSGTDMMEARFRAGPEIRFEPPQKLFSFKSSPSGSGAIPTFAVMADGERFVMVQPLEPPPGIVVVQNWLDALE